VSIWKLKEVLKVTYRKRYMEATERQGLAQGGSERSNNPVIGSG
jgi:hypothetical protein